MKQKFREEKKILKQREKVCKKRSLIREDISLDSQKLAELNEEVPIKEQKVASIIKPSEKKIFETTEFKNTKSLKGNKHYNELFKILRVPRVSGHVINAFLRYEEQSFRELYMPIRNHDHFSIDDNASMSSKKDDIEMVEEEKQILSKPEELEEEDQRSKSHS